MKIKFKIDLNRLTLDDLVRLEEKSTSALVIRDILSKFVVGENEEYLPEDAAKRLIGSVSLTQLNSVMQKFSEAMEEVKNITQNPK